MQDGTKYHMHFILRNLAVEECRKQVGRSEQQRFVQPHEKIEDNVPEAHLKVCIQFVTDALTDVATL